MNHNRINKIEGLAGTSLCNTLQVLTLTENCICGLDDIVELIELKELHTIDLRRNPISRRDMIHVITKFVIS